MVVFLFCQWVTIMRIYFSSMAHPKRLSKRLAKLAGIPLSRAQQCCATMFAYKDWHELEQVTAAQLNPPSKPDCVLSLAIVETRREVIGTRLHRALAPNLPGGWNRVWDLMDQLDPTGSMPAEAAFVDRRLDDLFPREWKLDGSDPDVAIDYDLDPKAGFSAQVGMAGSRFYENLLRDAVEQAPTPSPDLIPSDDHGYRSFAFNFSDRSAFGDLREDAPSVAVIVFRLVPTIQENILTALELILHPGSFASNFITDDHADLFAQALVDYLFECRLWPNPEWPVCGASGGLALTLSGSFSRAPVGRIVDAMNHLLSEHEGLFDPEQSDWDDFAYLPIRTLLLQCTDDVPDEERLEDAAFQHREDIVKALVTRTKAMSRAPALLARILTDAGFGQYAEFAEGLSLGSFDEKVKFGAFVRSMERAKAIPTALSLFFRHDLADGLVAAEQPASGTPEFDAYTEETDAQQAIRFAAAARRLGDEDLAHRYEVSNDALWDMCFQMEVQLTPLFEDFAE